MEVSEFEVIRNLTDEVIHLKEENQYLKERLAYCESERFKEMYSFDISKMG